VTHNILKDKFHLIYHGKIEAKNKGEMDLVHDLRFALLIYLNILLSDY
jgi:hypothetical protein